MSPPPPPPTQSLRPSQSHGSLSNNSDPKAKTRACDACRVKKSRCDGPLIPGSICSRCSKTGKPCTYLNSSQPRGPPKAYVTALEDRLENIETLIRRLRPDVDLSAELGSAIVRGSWQTDRPDGPEKRPDGSEPHSSPSPKTVVLPSAMNSLPDLSEMKGFEANVYRMGHEQTAAESDSDHSSDSEDLELDHHEESVHGVTRLTLINYATPPEARFHGNNASSGLAERIRRLQETYAGAANMEHSFRRASPTTFTNRRPQFWKLLPWERYWEYGRNDGLLDWVLNHFPPPSLCRSLIDLYFKHFNPCYPLLHRPTFEKHWTASLHHENHWFAAVCLSMFAVASRWSDDRGVLPPSEQNKEEPSWHQAGSTFAEVVIEAHHRCGSLLNPPSLFELQTFPLLAMYTRGTPHFAISWTIIATGIRKAQDAGVHSRKLYRHNDVLVQELWKRAFFLLYTIDRLASVGAGRPWLLRSEDFDVDLPLEVDDEYLDPAHPTHPFQQPASVPSKMVYFNLFVKLMEIMTGIVDFIYSIDKSNEALAANQETASRFKEMNEILIKWLQQIPEHLKWSNQSRINDPTLSNQSFTLYVAYAGIQTLMYRPFITLDGVSPSRKHEVLPFPARDICINSARTLARLIQEQLSRGVSNVLGLVAGAHTGAAIILMSVWQLEKERKRMSNDKEGHTGDARTLSRRIQSLKQDAEILVSSLESFAPRWEVIGGYLAKLKSSLPEGGDTSKQHADHKVPIPNVVTPSRTLPQGSQKASPIHQQAWPPPPLDLVRDHGVGPSPSVQTHFSAPLPSGSGYGTRHFSAPYHQSFPEALHHHPSQTISTDTAYTAMSYPSEISPASDWNESDGSSSSYRPWQPVSALRPYVPRHPPEEPTSHSYYQPAPEANASQWKSLGKIKDPQEWYEEARTANMQYAPAMRQSVQVDYPRPSVHPQAPRTVATQTSHPHPPASPTQYSASSSPQWDPGTHYYTQH